MADLSEFHNAEAGVVREAPPTAKFVFTPGKDVGSAEFVVESGEEPQAALDRWAADLLGMDPGTMSLLQVVEVRAWGHNPETGEAYRYVKAQVRKVNDADRAARDAADRWLSRPANGKRKSVGKGTGKAKSVGMSCAEWWPISDTQIGKGGEERFGGLSETMARLDWAADALVDWHDARRKAGFTPERIVVPLAGDMTEGCYGSYDNQQFITSLNAADQLELAIAATERIVERALDAAPEVIVTGVASNHDRQSRMSSRENITDAWDDRTFVLLRTLARIYDRLGYDRVKVQMPNNPHVSVVDDGHLIVATIHGHKPKYKGTAANTMWEWWKAEIATRRDSAAASVLLAGHYHHGYTLGPQSGRMLIGLPSLDGGSAYFEAAGGDWSMPGVRPFLTTADGVRDVDMLVWDQDREWARTQVGGPVA
jgi:hypothetical protein